MPSRSEKAQLYQQQQQNGHPQLGQLISGGPDDDTDLPGYSETPSPSSAPATHNGPATDHPKSLSTIPGFPALDLSRYVTEGASLSKDETTITVSGVPKLCSNPDALMEFLTAQAALPPRPQIHITGSHSHYGQREVDFDIRISLLRYLIPSASAGGGAAAPLNYVKLVGPNEMAFRGETAKNILPHPNGGLKEWARRFCRDTSTAKAFVLERTVPNWNTSLLEGRIRNLLASLRYQGRVTVEFPITYSTVVVTTSPTILPRIMSFMVGTNRYAVVEAVWPYANTPASSSSVSPSTEAATSTTPPRRVCAVQSEEVWWDAWNDVLAAAIMEKRKGRLTPEDVMDRAMMGNPPIKVHRDWGVNC